MAITLDGSNGITTDIASNESATFNRDTTDGDLIILQKDNVAVGSIGANSSQVYVAGAGAGLKCGTANLRPTNGSGATTDNAVALGSSSFRFTDLYLSGGVYLGGTGAANYLDDYEEGTWTPTVDTGTVSVGSNSIYVKVGKLVTVWCQLSQFSNRTSTGQITISGLPFTGETGFAHGGVFGQYCDTDAQSVYMIGSGLSLRLVRNDSGAFHYVQYNDLNNSSASFYIGTTYKIA